MIVLGGRDVDGLDIIGFEVKPYIIVFPYTNVKISRMKIWLNLKYSSIHFRFMMK